MSKVTEAVALIKKIAADNSHGYDQAHRWGPDFDCSSLVISVWQDVGVPVKSNGATYTGNMKAAFLKSGFEDVTGRVNLYTGYGLRAGDVLLNYASHTAMMTAEHSLVQASINENGTTTGGKTGDQTGREIAERGYFNYSPGGWDCVLRYTKPEEVQPAPAKPEPAQPTAAPISVQTLPTLKKGDKGETVRAAQLLLIGRGFKCGWWGADADFGDATREAVIKLQSKNGIPETGTVGPREWAVLLGVTK